ncbi:ABC transporter substrate-binding protein [Bacillus sp. THAF10]|uniref:ABC transporter substrate-binding protein n=1 Tax=Bacillus sp. THAF10 TaxID=2587848 RepID=UPI0015621C83|nr:extracellular solute-binding protein [Bacillus sp. THAF10]
MKLVKPWIAILASFMLVVGCSNNNASNETNDEKSKEDQVTIKFASWALGTEEDQNLERLMIDAFEEEHPNIKVEIDESIATDDWNNSLSSAASANAMPDLFMVSQVPTGLANDWLLDVTEMAKADEEFAKIPEVVTNSVTYNESIYAIPSAQHFLGYFVNKDLYNQANLDVPEYGFSVDEFTESVRSITNVKNGVVGLNNPFAIVDWYPSAVNEAIGWYTFNDGEYHLDSNEFISGVNLTSNFVTNGYSYDNLTDDQKANFNGEHAGEVFASGGIGLNWDGSWAVENFSKNLDFDWDFVGTPGGRTVIVNDFMGISKSTEHPEEAYTFAKWMSFGKEGFLKRIDLAVEHEKAINNLPVTQDEEVLDAFFEVQDIPGLRTAYDNLGKGIVEPVKTVPGFVQSRWEAPTGVAVGDNPNVNIAGLIDASIKGELKIEDYAAQINELANQKYKEGKEAIGQ